MYASLDSKISLATDNSVALSLAVIVVAVPSVVLITRCPTNVSASKVPALSTSLFAVVPVVVLP